MKSATAETLIEIRDLLARIHDSHLGKTCFSLSLLEMAGLRDSVRRLNDAIRDDPPT